MQLFQFKSNNSRNDWELLNKFCKWQRKLWLVFPWFIWLIDLIYFAWFIWFIWLTCVNMTLEDFKHISSPISVNLGMNQDVKTSYVLDWMGRWLSLSTRIIVSLSYLWSFTRLLWHFWTFNKFRQVFKCRGLDVSIQAELWQDL